ncbi:uncharacterized protein BDV17DRAFT_287397 [Aspergillus undulatus]|uniref:uncharacterized protein n=1 Tax=Aspergillus undulatus TaxID=1810928 RepID=UPI003CCE2B29
MTLKKQRVPYTFIWVYGLDYTLVAFKEIVTARLICSPRLESEEGFGITGDDNSVNDSDTDTDTDGDETRIYTKRWYRFPCHMKRRYLQHKISQHKIAACVFSTWAHDMWEAIISRRNLSAASAKKVFPKEHFFHNICYVFAVGSHTSIQQYFRPGANFTFLHSEILESLDVTFRIITACLVIRCGNPADIPRLVNAGHDLTRRSWRFNIVPLKLLGVVKRSEAIRALQQVEAPYIFEGNRYRLDKEYLLKAIQTSDMVAIQSRLARLKANFRQTFAPITAAANEQARSHGNKDIMILLHMKRAQVKREDYWFSDWMPQVLAVKH